MRASPLRHRDVNPLSRAMEGFDQLGYDVRWLQAEFLPKKRFVPAVGADGLGHIALGDLDLYHEATSALAERLGLCRGERGDKGIAKLPPLHQG